MKALRKLFLSQLSDIYDAEVRITKALPKMIKAATCNQLREALQSHLQETEGHVTKVQRAFECFGEKPKQQKCKATAGLLEEGEQIISENKGTSAINAAIIIAGQKVEHYEIATYGTLRDWAKLLGNEDAAALLNEILDQEKAADRKLNELAKAKNEQAMQDAGTSEDDDNADLSAENQNAQRMAHTR